MTMGGCESQCLQSSLHHYDTSQHSESSQLIPEFSTGKVQPVSVTAEEIDATLEILKKQIAKSQAVLAYLSRRETLQTESCSRRKTALERLGFSEEGAGPHQCWSNFENAEFGARPSAVSTNLEPRRSHHLALSCPLLPNDCSLSAKSTQTESLVSSFKDSSQTEMSLPSKPWQKEIQTDNVSHKSCQYIHVPTLEFSQNSSKKEGNSSPLSSLFYRNRSFSFISAINEGSTLMTNPEELECLVKAQSLTVEGNDVLWFRHPKESIEPSTKDVSYDIRFSSAYNLEKSAKVPTENIVCPQNVNTRVIEHNGKVPAENVVCSQQPQSLNNTTVIENSRSNIPKFQTAFTDKKNTSEDIKNILSPRSQTTSTAPNEHSATFSLVSSSTGICRALVHCVSSKKTEGKNVENHVENKLPPPYKEAPQTLGQDISKSSSSPRDTSPDGSTYDTQSNIPLSQRSRRRSLERQCSIPTDLATAFPRLLMLAAVSEQSEQLSSCEESDSQETGADETGFPRNSTSKTEKNVLETENKNGSLVVTRQPDGMRETSSHIPRSETDKFNSRVLCRSYDDEEDEHEANHRRDTSTARRRKKNTVNGTGNCLWDQEKQDRVLATRVSEKWKKREGVSKSKNLMPDLMETSETESAKGSASGSMESETADLPGTDVVIPPQGGSDPSFPSNSDGFLRRLGLHKDSSLSNDSLTEQEIESKFGSLALAFKIDKLTLSKRLDLQQRQRDTAEKNVESEMKALKESLNTLNHQSISQQVREMIIKIQQQVDVLQQSTSRVSGRAEVYGAVQQEEKMSRAFDVMFMYVENLKRLYEKEHHELEEVRRLMTENRTSGEESKVQRSIRSSIVAGAPKPV